MKQPRRSSPRTRASASDVERPTTVEANADATPAPADDSSTEEAIRVRAYELYLARGGEPGRELEDWLTAERECRERPGSAGPGA